MSSHHENHHSEEKKPVAFRTPMILGLVTLLAIVLLVSTCDNKSEHCSSECKENGTESHQCSSNDHHKNVTEHSNHGNDTIKNETDGFEILDTEEELVIDSIN